MEEIRGITHFVPFAILSSPNFRFDHRSSEFPSDAPLRPEDRPLGVIDFALVFDSKSTSTFNSKGNVRLHRSKSMFLITETEPFSFFGLDNRRRWDPQARNQSLTRHGESGVHHVL